MTPRLIAALAGGGILLAGATGLYWMGRLEGAARERPKVEAARAQAAVAALEIRGERESAERAQIAVQRRDVATRSLTRLSQDALKSEDSNATLDPARADRLRRHDDKLCQAAPELLGCAQAGDTAGSAAPVRAPPASRRAKPS
jgi:hypothetical protein